MGEVMSFEDAARQKGVYDKIFLSFRTTFKKKYRTGAMHVHFEGEDFTLCGMSLIKKQWDGLLKLEEASVECEKCKKILSDRLS